MYDIAYYLKLDTAADVNDDIILEDGTGAVMSEVSKPEGLRVQDMENMFPNTFIPKFSDHARHRTNITYSAIDVKLAFKRRHTYYTLTLIIPILAITILSPAGLILPG